MMAETDSEKESDIFYEIGEVREEDIQRGRKGKKEGEREREGGTERERERERERDRDREKERDKIDSYL